MNLIVVEWRRVVKDEIKYIETPRVQNINTQRKEMESWKRVDN
jgi:hypothetical protein